MSKLKNSSRPTYSRDYSDEEDDDHSSVSDDNVDSEDSEEEPEFEETEEDRKFIVDDEEDEIEEVEDEDEEEKEEDEGDSYEREKRRHRLHDRTKELTPESYKKLSKKKKKRKKRRLEESDDEEKEERRRRRRRLEESDNELDEDDLDLVEENTGLKLKASSNFKRLKKGKRTAALQQRPKLQPHRDLAKLFDEDEDQGVDDLEEQDDFIVDDIESEDSEHERIEHRGKRADDKQAFAQRHRQRVYGKPPSGISEEALDDIHQVFGDGADYDWALQLQEEGDHAKPLPVDSRAEEGEEEEVKLTDVFEPSDVLDKMLTAEDEEMRVTDIPERFQMVRVKRLEGAELQESSQWCAMAIARARGQAAAYLESDESMTATITQLLKFLREDFLEVPFLIRHRKDYWDPILTEDEVWKVWEEDILFHAFYQKRNALFSKYRKLGIDDPIFMDCFFSVADIESIHDINAYLIFKYGRQLAEIASQAKGARVRKLNSVVDSHRVFRTDAITRFVDSFLLKELNFMENYRNSGTIHPPPTPQTELSDVVATLVPPSVGSKKFLDALVRYLGLALFHYPELRRVYREKYADKALLSIHPTDLGKSVLKPGHPYYSFKYIENKHLRAIKHDQYLNYHEAEKLGLVQIQFTLDDASHFFQRLVQAYATREGDEWNSMRIAIFNAADAHLTKHAEQSLREKLLKDSMEAVGRACSEKLYSMVHVAPYVPAQPAFSSAPSTTEKKEAKVLALGLCQEGKTCEVYGVLVHRKGKVEDYYCDKPSLDELSGVLAQWTPEVIVVGVFAHPFMWRLLETLKRLTSESLLDPIPVEHVSDDVAKVYASSEWAKKEFPDFKPAFRYCVGLARFLQEPLHVVSALFPRDILNLSLHRNQALLPEELLMQFLEKAMMRTVGEVGVDLNHAYNCPYVSHALQFVSGLGRRKANGLLQKMPKVGLLSGREALITNQLMGKIVFLNCASFIRIDRAHVGYDQFDPLDGTRIHPEDYSLARKMAKDALDIDEPDEEDDFLSKYVEELMEGHADALDELSLDDYAQVIEQKTDTKKRCTLEMIKAELKSPYSETRPTFSGMPSNAVFGVILGEDVKKGALVEVTITKLTDKYARCRLLHGVDGIIFPRNICDKSTEWTSLVQVGQKKQGVVLDIDFEKGSVNISLQKKDIEASLTTVDPESIESFADPAKYEQDAKDELARRHAAEIATGQPSLPAPAKHPLFRPFNAQQAFQYLRTKEPGEAIIRPSSEGEHHFVISWLVVRDVLQHLNIIQDPVTKKCKLKLSAKAELEFHDLDEILFRYVEPCAQQVGKVLSFRKYYAGTRHELEPRLARDVKASPGTVAYGICANHEYPGHFTILFMSQVGIPYEMGFKIVPNGFSYMGYEYTSMEQVMNAFKNGFNPVS